MFLYYYNHINEKKYVSPLHSMTEEANLVSEELFPEVTFRRTKRLRVFLTRKTMVLLAKPSCMSKCRRRCPGD